MNNVAWCTENLQKVVMASNEQWCHWSDIAAYFSRLS